MVFLLILSLLLSIGIPLHIFFARNANALFVSEDVIVLEYRKARTKRIPIAKVQEIRVTPYRYIFLLKEGGRLFVSRLKPTFGLEKDIRSEIQALSAQYGIDLRT